MGQISLPDIWREEKSARAIIIKKYMAENGIGSALCFSCGNASAALRLAGVDLLDISPRGDMTANRWFTQKEIARRFPGVFDATSGHLPVWMMTEIAGSLSSVVELNEGIDYIVPAGSGETAVCLKIAFPKASIIPVYDDNDPATEWNDAAPLNAIVRAMFSQIIRIYKQTDAPMDR